jgi:hypothetical protein
VPRLSAPLAVRDQVILAIGLSIWLVCWTLSFRCVVRGTPYPAIAIARTARDAYPVVSGFYPWLPGEASGLRVGDVLVRLGHADLRGLRPVDLVMLVPEEAHGESVPVVYERSGERRATALPLGSLTALWPSLPSSLVFVVACVLLFVRARPTTPLVRATAFTMLAAGIYLGSNVLEPRAAVYPQLVIRDVAASLIGPLALRSLFEFRGDGPVGALERFAPWLLAVAGPVELAGRLTGSAHTERIEMALSVVVVMAIVVVGTLVYRRADPLLRRQARWVIYGFYCALAPAGAILLLVTIEPRLHAVSFATPLFGAVVPVCMLIAIARYNLLDIDRLISATASYNIVLVMLVAVGFVAGPRVAAAASATLGVDQSLGQTTVALALAAVVVPAHRRLRPRLERIFFPERWAVDRGVEALLQDLPTATTAKDLLVGAAEQLNGLVRPETCALHVRVGSDYVPLFRRGEEGAASVFPANGPLIAALQGRIKALMDGGRSISGASPDSSAFDLAALEMLGAQIVVPIHRMAVLAAFLSLGRKRSGDVYTGTDVALLSTIALAIGNELLRFGSFDQGIEGASPERSLRGDSADPGSWTNASYQVFLSYRREGGAAEARAIHAALSARGLSTFLDVDGLHAGAFAPALTRVIVEASMFVVLLTPGSLDRLDEGDWFRREITEAFRANRTIVPIITPGFEFPATLPPELHALPAVQCLHYTHEYFDAMITKLLGYVHDASLPN